MTEYRLANGARVLLFPEASRPTVTVNMTVLVGSRHEGYGESGMAHLLEHMVFKGTPDHPHVPKALRDHGASFNGTTNDDRTNYFETMPATDENLEFGIALESDRLVNSFVKREDLLSEMTVVRNEFERGENNPGSVLNQRIYAAAYEWHNYGKSTIGNRSDIERVPIENLQAFYKKYYQPDNVVLIVAGKFEEAKALALVEKYLGSIPKPTRKLDATYTEEPPQDGERTVTLRRVGAVGSVGVAYHIPSASHADWAPLSLLGGIISQSPNGRLYKALVESKLATNASARSDNAHDPGLFFASASCPPENARRRARRPGEDARIARRRAVHRGRGEQGEGPQQAERGDAAVEQPGDVAGPELGVEPRRLAVAVHPARSHRRRDRGRRQPRGEDLFPEAQPHGRRLHPGQGIDAARGAGRSRHRPGREGLQGRRRRGGGRGLRPLAGQPRCPDQDRQRRRPEGRPAAQEEPRRDGLARADLALRQRGIAQGPDGRGRDAPRPDDGRHEEARSPGPPRGTRFAGHPHLDRAAVAAAAGVAAVAAAAGAAAPRGN